MAPIKKSLAILNSSLILVLAAYIPNVIFTRLVYLNWEIPAIVFILPLKIFIYGGIYGTLVELISGEKITLEFKRLKINAKKYWKYYSALTIIPLLFYFSIITNNSFGVRIDAFSFFASINPLLLFILSLMIIRDKYIKPLGLRSRRIPIPLPVLMTMLALFIAGLLVFHLPSILRIPNFELSRITKFIYSYISLLIYIYFVNLALEQYPEVQSKFEHEKEIYLINSPGGGIAFHLSSVLLRMYPPVFVVIKALTPKGYKFREFNRIFWKDHYYAPGKLVAMTCFTSNSIDTYRIAQEFRRRGSKVILGGPHVTYFPDEALEYCDSVVCGEAENVWPQVMEDYENGTLQEKYTGMPAENCHELVYQELLNSPPEIIKDFLETSRGCKFKCYFCTVPSLSQGSLRKQKISNLIELVKKVKEKYSHVLFIDNNIYSDPAYTKKLFCALKPLKIKWATSCSIDIAKNKDTLLLAKESGCTFLLFGFEISEGSFEKAQGGKMALVDHYKEYAKEVKKMGITIKAHYIFGFKSDTFKHLYKFWKFCFSINPFATALSILTPFPGSQFYYDSVREDRISNLNWRHYGGQTLVFNHPRMNNFILAKLYPFISLLFLFTTSKIGYILLCLIVINILGFI